MAVTKIDGTRQIAASSITNSVQNFGTPSASTDVATKGYVDSVAQGLDVKPASTVATIAALSPANTYSNGTLGVGATLTATGVGILTVDGHNTVLNDIILVKNQASGLQNGMYQVTTAGTAGVAYVLTRITQMDTTLEFQGSFTFVEGFGTLINTGWVCTNATAPTVGTDPITFAQFSGAGTYTSGSGITITGQSIAVDTAVTMTQTNSMTGITNKTFVAPVLGAATATSLATSAATPLLMTNGQLVNVALTSQTSGATTLTIPDFAGVVDEFTFKTKAQTMSNKTLVAPVLGAATGTSLVLSSKIDEAKGSDIASATTTDIGAAIGNYINITGTTTITGLGTIQAGTRRIVNFNGILTLTYNATSLILPTAANITTAAGDTATFVSLGAGNWICVGYQRASGSALVAGASAVFHAVAISGTQNSSNKVFTLASAVSTGSEQIFLNGQLLTPGAGNDYTISTTTVTFEAGFTAPAATDTLRAYGSY